jgi:hypothetical protein
VTAIIDCPQKAHRQRAFHRVLLGDYSVSAKLLAASLAAACAAVDDSSDADSWYDSIRDDYRRFPALQREFHRCKEDL